MAHRQEKTTKTTERAYLKMSHVSPPGVNFDGLGQSWVRMEVRNYGRTPAEITAVVVDFKWAPIGEPVPPPINKPTGNGDMKAFLVTNQAFYFTHQKALGVSLKDDIKDGKQNLFVFGYVDYIDKFRQHHRAGYARVYNRITDTHRKGYAQRNNLDFVTQEGYNYDHQRKHVPHTLGLFRLLGFRYRSKREART
jgi:hypothetical protein